jgi:formimidoylglutamate deiminase
MPNLHSHAFQRAMAGLTEYRSTSADSFWSWRELMYRFAHRITPDDMDDIARWLYIEMLKVGYTSVCEFHYVHHAPDGRHYANAGEMAGRAIQAAADVGIGITVLPVLYQYGGFGATAPTPGQQRFLHSPDSLLDMLDALRRTFPASSARQYGVAPHSLRAVSDASLQHVTNVLHRMMPDAPVHIHIAEQIGEVDACLAAYGQRPVEWLFNRLPVDTRWCLVHATHIDDDERDKLAQSGAVAGLCLTTEANLGDGIFPAQTYLDAGGRFGIGSDSHVAVDWRAELRLLEYGQRLVRRQRNVLASARTAHVADRLFDAAVDGGGQATGRPVGPLQIGHRADLLVIDSDHLGIAGHQPDTWLSSIVFAEHGGNPIRDVMVGGSWMIRQGQHAAETIARTRFQQCVARLLGT